MPLANPADPPETLAGERGAAAAPAKINLDLRILGRRWDGYHDLDSLVVFTAFGDRLYYEPADEFSIEIDGPFAADAPIAENIVLKAARLLEAEFSGLRPLRFRLSKNLPVASGIGGGSSDAAAAMRAIVETNRLEIDPEGLRDIGAVLGADIPVCLFGRTARMRGTGLRLDPVRGLPKLPLVLVNPGRAVETAEVFAARRGEFAQPRQSGLQVNASVTSLALWLRDSRNDLEDAAKTIAPEIETAIASLEVQDGVLLARMSGSGATCFGIFTDARRADIAANRIATRHPDWWTIATQTLE